MSEKSFEKFNPVAVIGAGTIGISWAALFLAHGLTVRVHDPALPDTKNIIWQGIEKIKPTLKSLGLPTEGLTDRLDLEPDLEHALAGVMVVQENGPERIEFKRDLFGRVEQLVSDQALLLSSSSGIPASVIAKRMKKPERLLIGHPYNPPHLMPLVEVVPGPNTDPMAVDDAVEFYSALGKEVIVIKKEVPGFVGNRLQAALLREAMYLVSEDVVTMKDLDRIVENSIGLRWAVGGPFLSNHLAGGKGGFAAFITHLGPQMNAAWKAMANFLLDDAAIKKLSDEAATSFGATPIVELEQERDKMQVAVLNTLKRTHTQ